MRTGGVSKTKRSAAVLAVALTVFVLAAPAAAQDKSADDDAKTTAGETITALPTKGADEDKTAREEAVATMPTWGGLDTNYQESIEETFFRLAQDFVSTAELGVRRLGSVPIWPRGELKVGRVRLAPYLRQAVEYETNVFLRKNSGTRDAFFGPDNGRDGGGRWVTQAGLFADSLHMGGRLRIAASADARWFEQFESDQNDTWEIDTQVGATYQWPTGVWVRGGYAYERRADPIEIRQPNRNDFERSNNRYFFTAGLDRDIFFGTKIQYEGGVHIRDTRAKDQDTFEAHDYTEAEWYLKASYPFWKDTTRIFGRARYRTDNRESPVIDDGDVWGFDAGIEGNIPLSDGEVRGLRGSVSVGFDHATYDSSSRTRSGRDERRNTSLAIRGALQYILSRKTTMDLRLLRTNQFSVDSNYQITDRVDFTVTHSLTNRWTLRVATFLEHSDPSADRGVIGDNRSKRNFTRGGVGAGARYVVNEWLDADASWDYERQNAPGASSYTNHRFVLGLTFFLSALRPQARRTLSR